MERCGAAPPPLPRSRVETCSPGASAPRRTERIEVRGTDAAALVTQPTGACSSQLALAVGVGGLHAPGGYIRSTNTCSLPNHIEDREKSMNFLSSSIARALAASPSGVLIP